MAQEDGSHFSFVSVMKKAVVVFCGLCLVLTIRFFPTLSAEVKQSLRTMLLVCRMMLPIAGIPPEQAYKILDRNRDRLMALPGVKSVGMGANGIYVTATNPSILPKEVEGLRIEAHRPLSEIAREQSIGSISMFSVQVRRISLLSLLDVSHRAVNPPSITNSLPVTNDDSSDAK